LNLTICSSRYLTFQPSIGIAMSLNSYNNKNNDKKRTLKIKEQEELEEHTKGMISRT
jgi:hypothetical protein